jgi:endonuclease YncB( thermonuclease family)
MSTLGSKLDQARKQAENYRKANEPVMERARAQAQVNRTQPSNYDPNADYTPFQRGIRQASYELPQTIESMKGYARAALGDEEGAAQNWRRAADYKRRGARVGPETKSLSQMQGLGDYWEAVQGQAGRILPDLALTTATAIGTGGMAALARGGAGALARGAAAGAARQGAAGAAFKTGANVGATSALALQQMKESGAVPLEPANRAAWEERLRQDRLTRARTAPDARGRAHVVDGDTVHLYDREGNKIDEVRLLGINTADVGQGGKQDAAARLQALIGDREVSVVGNKRDAYGRRLSYIYADGEERDLGELLVQSGAAAPNAKYLENTPDFYWRGGRQAQEQGIADPWYANRFADSPVSGGAMVPYMERGAPLENGMAVGEDGQPMGLREQAGVSA